MSKMIAEGWSVVVDRPDGTWFALKGHGGIDGHDDYLTSGMAFETKRQAERCCEAALDCGLPCRVVRVQMYESPDEETGAKP